MRRKPWRMQLTLLRTFVSKRPQSTMKPLKELRATRQNRRRDTNRLAVIRLGTLTTSLSKPSKKLRDSKICISPTSHGINEKHE